MFSIVLYLIVFGAGVYVGVKFDTNIEGYWEKGKVAFAGLLAVLAGLADKFDWLMGLL